MQTQVINDGSCIRMVNDDLQLLICKSQIRAIETVNDAVRIDIGEGPLRQIFIKYAAVTVPAGLADANALRDAIKAMLDNTTDLTGLITALQQGVTALQQAISSMTQTQGGTDSQSFASLKQSIDAIGTAISGMNSSAQWQDIHDVVVSSGADVKNAVQGLTQQLSGSGATQASFLAGIQQGVENLGTVFTNASSSAGLQTLHADIVNAGNTQAGLLTSIIQLLTTIHASQDLTTMFMSPIRIDGDPGFGITYNGFAANPNAATSDPVWAIQRVTFNGRDTYTYEWAFGTQQFTNIWDNRQSLVYGPLTNSQAGRTAA